MCWRQTDGYLGWAPLPLQAVYKVGVGSFYRGSLAVNSDFGLKMDAFTFVAHNRFWDHNLRMSLVPHERLAPLYRASREANGYRVNRGRFLVEGPGPDHIVKVTHHDAPRVRVIHQAKPRARTEAPSRDRHEERRREHR